VTTVQTRPVPPKRRAKSHKRVSRRRYMWRRIWVATLGVVVIILVIAGISLGQTLSQPSTDPMSARVAEWARNNGLGAVVTMIETIQYQLNPPKIGGKPTDMALLNPVKTAPQGRQSARINPLAKPVTPVVSPALPGEGQWHVVVSNASGPVVATAYVRPSSMHSSYLAGVAWMRSNQLKFALHPGYNDPGSSALFHSKDTVAGATTGLVATFNAGFKIRDARGGFYLNGHTAGQLTNGAASLVIYKDRTMRLGMWGRDFTMNSQVVGVRQNLKLLIDHGKLASNLDAAVQSNWGATIKGAYYVWRSGIGVRADGNFVYVAGDALSVRDVAVLLKNAGAVEGMQLDINPAWISYMWYTHGSTFAAHKLVNFQRPVNRYLEPTSRDFFAVYLR